MTTFHHGAKKNLLCGSRDSQINLQQIQCLNWHFWGHDVFSGFMRFVNNQLMDIIIKLQKVNKKCFYKTGKLRNHESLYKYELFWDILHY